MKKGGKVRLGISACLFGGRFRYDGADKRDEQLIKMFSDKAEFVPVCPEVECGLSVPREPMHLTASPDKPRLIVISTGEDLTDVMKNWIEKRVEELASENISGFILKARSPSCAIDDVELHGANGVSFGKGAGLFARALMKRFPNLPVSDEEKLRVPRARDDFIDKIFSRLT